MRIIFLLIHLFLVSFLFAQTEQGLKLKQQELYLPIDITPLSVKFNYQLPQFESLRYIKSLSFDTLYKSNELHFTKLTNSNAFSFNQEKKEDTFIGLGNYEHFKNNFTFNRKDRLLINFEIGLVKQSTIQSFDNINFHLSMRTLIEYKITKTLSAYMYGQYITSPLNKDKSSFDSFSYMNPLFLQTEIGTGLRASYKNFKTDVGMKSIRDNQFNQIKSINSMDTKITISF
jgi:hypothetical protein